MGMNLKQIARIYVQFSPWSGNSTSAREFLSRIVCAQGTNPDCKIESKVCSKGDPYIEVEFENKKVEHFDSGNMTVADIVNRVKGTAEEMDMGEKLAAAGLKGTKFESMWLKTTKREEISGAIYKIPRQ